MVHPESGLPTTPGNSGRCGDCSWASRTGDALVCLAAAPQASWEGPTVGATSTACDWFETGVHCDPCGACCREAFDSVPLPDEDEDTARAHPDLVRTAADGWRDLKRVPGQNGGTRCICLRGDGQEAHPFRCTIYADRPTACRDLMPGEPNCLFARRRVGLSKGPL